jgi:hypothetical protein
MACFDVNGQNISCSDDLCVGGDCDNWFNPTGSPDEEVFIPSMGTEGLWNMNQGEFMDWFESLHDWGSSLEGIVLAGQEAPVLIPWHEAEQIGEMFGPYSRGSELYILGQLAQQQEFSNDMFNDWQHSANVQLYGKQEREREILSQTTDLEQMGSDLQLDASAGKERISKMKKTAEDRKIASAKSAGKKVTREEAMSENQLESMVTNYLINKSVEEESLSSRLESLISENQNKEIESRAQLDMLINQKDVSRQKKLRRDYEVKRDFVSDLRDQYEADIWQVIGEFGLSQRFLQSGQV